MIILRFFELKYLGIKNISIDYIYRIDLHERYKYEYFNQP